MHIYSMIGLGIQSSSGPINPSTNYFLLVLEPHEIGLTDGKKRFRVVLKKDSREIQIDEGVVDREESVSAHVRRILITGEKLSGYVAEVFDPTPVQKTVSVEVVNNTPHSVPRSIRLLGI